MRFGELNLIFMEMELSNHITRHLILESNISGFKVKVCIKYNIKPKYVVKYTYQYLLLFSIIITK
ncbi:hypothetical protein GCM10010918_20290 [Paenibacillus radicis (ex Gao et al. 2016)]|uniref:Uncharacterized protein n=1 Tax=Paenibacillus radicis (ex Gao et al. 2016) TaxID=1737354 RepID=A0A917LXR3_9BACL|nr:hypothetical protein GCM10010918_20290 [Paenibacillus radicis (ex Gao et al. 2016)]